MLGLLCDSTHRDFRVKALNSKLSINRQVAHVYNPSTWDIEDQKFWAILSHIVHFTPDVRVISEIHKTLAQNMLF